MTRHFIGLPGFLNRLPLLAPGGVDPDDYAQQLRTDLRDGQRATVRVMMAGREVDLQLNPAALMWWYLTSEEEQTSDVDARWPAPSE